ncbi:MAG: carbamoyl-phosphate synthase large subunit [Clostridia bacterium]|nr:carbamoyl-phosphate synthase large subunit [Clostridia bacterium]
MPKDKNIHKVLVIGSGPIVIGQAAEFDYAGAQACRVLRAEGIHVVLVNSNPATIMTDKHFADAIYLEPLNPQTVRRIIEKERPDGLLAGLGGQTGLTIAMQLSRDGTLKKYGVKLLGTPVEAIDKAEDRELFRNTMKEIGQPCVPSEIANDVETALAIAIEIGYPVIVRPAFTLGGSGGGIAATEEELKVIARTGLDMSPITQILVEKCISGWKEIEFETMRDAAGNVIAICSMENVDPVGVHTGDSVVVAPALTLSTREYQMLRAASLDIVASIGIVGGCNCQFALNPNSFEYAVIEVNPRVSRSSALASKASGYPIAKITTKLALGYTLDEINNDITGKTCACFEPTLDYVVVKFPKWPFDKFAGSSRQLGTQMKATGEVMSIGPSFEMALMKAVRGAEISLDTLNAMPLDDKPVRERLHEQNDRRLFTVFEALKSGVTIEEIYEITKIDPWFLARMAALASFEGRLATEKMTTELYREAKKLGYPDNAIKRLASVDTLPDTAVYSYKMVDTCAAEFHAETPYFYSTTDEICESRQFRRSGKPVVMVLGSGPIRIGQGIEFDYSSVHCVWTLQKMGYDVVIVNNNPETVSTDYDTADRLYFEPLCAEDVMNIIEVEKPIGVVVAFGGQTAIKLTQFLDAKGVRILGTSADGIDLAEDRARFDELLETFGFRRPKGMGVKTEEEALAAANKLGYPVLLRPSYVIGGQNMTISRSDAQTSAYMRMILSGGIENPVLVDKYMPGTELEVDVISDGTSVLIPGIMEHIERAGVHSGDSIAVYPPFNLSDKHMQTICECSEKLALALGTKGLVNIQYLIYEGELYVIEVNPRASRTIPYISKVTNVPMVDLAAKVMLGAKLADLGYGTGLYRTPPYYTVKVPVFSFEKLSDANSILGPEMKSTGEVLGIGKTMAEALFKGLTGAGLVVPMNRGRSCGVLLSVEESDYLDSISLAKRFYDLGITVYATRGTANAISQLGIDVIEVANGSESNEISDLMESGALNYIIYTGAVQDVSIGNYTMLHRRAMQLGIPCLTSLDTANALAEILESRFTSANTELVDINAMRLWRQKIPFVKMHSCGNDYIYIENFDGKITCPESLCVSLCTPHYGIGGDGIVLIERSGVADAKMRTFNRDGTEGRMGGNNIRCVGKYLYDMGYIRSEYITIETVSGINKLHLYLRDGKVNSVSVDMGKAELLAKNIPVETDLEKVINAPVYIGGTQYDVTCVSVGNPHCVSFVSALDALDLAALGPKFEYADMFPDRVNVEFVRVVNKTTLRVRVWERGNGETLACGTGACAAVVAACENGYCEKGTDIAVKLPGGTMTVNYTDERVLLNGSAVMVYSGSFEY